MNPVPKPVRETTDYQAKAIETSGKIATFDGKCRMWGCGHTREGGWEIHPHHIIHRKYGNTCALPENLFPCCIPCHGRIHHNETEFKQWLEGQKPGLYDMLWEKAREICRLDWDDVYGTLLMEYKRLLEEKVANEAK